ncbi:uncharacterized protein BX663DRAFT_117776 [Cokeromyces recurvatus]|uniref:uncharacterized protein n=1 Tax=Cokeromyces recurvatus TaxID=90255 RepID=UPI00221FE95C|nr:uncharacterized protein BX663DRAFT_117776 [Cokeromyces recurvatus]KAI7901260.1 hypothetical protein BX663DRAFT_117776 [Cokeromyces recurvatus]
MMSNYEQSNTPLMNEKLPGIDKLPKIEENNNIIIENNSTYLPPPCAGNTLNPGLMYPHHISPPLTPAVSPSSVLYDSLQFKRKFSVDVGPFSFGTSSMDQDAYRRSSCSAISMEGIQNNTQRCHEDQADYSFLNSNNDIQQTMTVHQQLKTPSSSSSTTTTTTRRGHHLTAGPITKHKHVCKYPYCKWSFKRYEHLKRHMLVHTGKRPHVCTYPNCGKSFSRSDNFHAHYRTHTRKENMAYQTKRSTKAAKTTNTITTSMVTPDDDTTTTTTTTTTSPSSIPNVTTQHVFDDRANPFFIKQEPQSFDMSSYQDMYHHHHHRPSYPSEVILYMYMHFHVL